MQREIKFKCYLAQEKFMAAALSGKYKLCCYAGGAGSGKTFGTLGVLLIVLNEYPGSRAVIIRSSYATLNQTTVKSFDKIVPRSFIKDWNTSEQKVTFVNSSQLLFFSENWDDDKLQNRFKGLEYNFLLLEEASELMEYTFNKSWERTGRDLLGSGKQLSILTMLTSNAEPGWVKDRLYTPWKEGMIETLHPDWFFLQSTMFENPYYDEEYFENFKRNSTYLNWQKFGLGDWDVSPKPENAIYKSFSPEKHVCKCSYNPELPLWISWDENVNPYTPVAVFQIVKEKEKKNIYQIKEILGRHPYNNVEGVCNMIKREYPHHQSGMFITGDATSLKADTKIMSGHNLFTLVMGYLKQYAPVPRWLKSNPSVVMRINFWNMILEKEYLGIKFLIDENCKESVNDFIKTREDVDGTKLKEVAFDPRTKTVPRLWVTCPMLLIIFYALLLLLSSINSKQVDGHLSR